MNTIPQDISFQITVFNAWYDNPNTAPKIEGNNTKEALRHHAFRGFVSGATWSFRGAPDEVSATKAFERWYDKLTAEVKLKENTRKIFRAYAQMGFLTGIDWSRWPFEY